MNPEEKGKLYKQLNKLLEQEREGEEGAVLYGDGGRPYVVSKNKRGGIVVSGGGGEHVVFPDGEQMSVNNN